LFREGIHGVTNDRNAGAFAWIRDHVDRLENK